MRIVFDESTLAEGQNAGCSITGVLDFDFSGFFFPAERWNDFVVVIATWWLSALQRLERGIEREGVLRFMDGPYSIAIVAQDGDLVLLRCIEDRRDACVVHEEHVSLSQLGQQVRRLAKQLASACERGRFDSSDVDALRKYLPD